jgi:hypothetical protein
LAKAKTPDESELIAQQFLLHSGHWSVDYEPCGRDTAPDFLVDGQIAVEVRRLNQNFVSRDGRVEGVEQQWRSIWKKLFELVTSFPAPLNGQSWFLSIRFRRPVDWNLLRPKIRQALNDFINQPARSACNISLSPNFRISLHPAGQVLRTFFVMAVGLDSDRGGWVGAEVLENIHLCIDEKTRVINRSNYAEWWLLLIDRTGLGFDKNDYESLREATSFGFSFDRVLLINPYSGNDFKIYP